MTCGQFWEEKVFTFSLASPVKVKKAELRSKEYIGQLEDVMQTTVYKRLDNMSDMINERVGF